MRSLKLHAFQQWADQPAPQWLVPDFIPECALGSVTAAPESFKSWLLMTLALKAADGGNWRGEVLPRFSAIYFATENARSHAPRQADYLARNETTADGAFIVEEQIDLLHQDCADEMKKAVKRAEELCDLHCRLVIVDTIRDAWSGNEDSSTESARALATLKSLRDELGVSVVFAHHCGHAGERERGSSNWRANVDFAWHFSRSGDVSTARCLKMRDAPHPEPFSFGLDTDAEGRTELKFIDQVAASEKSKSPMKGQKRLALDELINQTIIVGTDLPRELGMPSGVRGVSCDAWRQAFYNRLGDLETDSKRKAYNRALVDLQSAKQICVDGDWVWAVDQKAGQDGTPP